MRSLLPLALLLATTACISFPTRPPVYAPRVLPSGVVTRELTLPDEGRALEGGEHIALDYELYLQDGTLVDSSADRGMPIELVLGEGSLGPGFEEGLLGLRLHGRREIVVPPELAFGEAGLPPRIPARAILRMRAELVRIEEGPTP